MTTNKLSNRLLAMVMVISMMATMFAGITFASAEVGTPATEVTLSGVTLNSETPYLLENSASNVFAIKASAVPSEDGFDLHATFEDGTLTFNKGFNLGATDETWIEAGPDWNSMFAPVLDTTDNTYYVLKANGDLTIDTGSYNNFFYYDWTGNVKDRNNCTVSVDGDLTITGNGLIQITSNPSFDEGDDADELYTSYGIKAAGDVNLLGGTVYIYEALHSSTVGGDETTTFISAGSGNINLDGALLKFRGSGLVDAKVAEFDGTLNYNADAYDVTTHPQYVTSKGDQGNGARGFVRSYPSWAGAGSSHSVTYSPLCALSFETDGGSAVETVYDFAGATVDLGTYTSTKAGYDFAGWFAEAELVTPLSTITLSGNTTVYAKWVAEVVPVGPASEVIYAGKTLNTATPYLVSWVVSGSGLQIKTQATDAVASGESVLAYFDASTGTLEYRKGMMFASEVDEYEPDFGWNTYVEAALVGDAYYGIKANGDLTIDLGGHNNFINMGWNKLFAHDLYGVYADGDVTITGNGYLKLPATLVQNTDTESGDNAEHASYGIYANGGNVTLDCGTVMIYSRMYHRWEAGSNTSSTAIYADGDISLGNTILKIRYQEANGSGTITHFSKDPVDLASFQKTEVNVNMDGGNLSSLGYAYIGTGANHNCFNYTPEFTLSFVTNGGSTIETEKFAKGTVVDLSEYSTEKPDYTFDGWYTEEGLVNKVTSVTLNSNTTVYAKWREIVSAATEVIYAGQTLNSETPYLISWVVPNNGLHIRSQADDTLAEGESVLAYFDASTGTLEYRSGMELTTQENAYEPDFGWNTYVNATEIDGAYYGIKANGHLTIDTGDYNNFIGLHWTDLYTKDLYGIWANGNVTITGNGYLKLPATFAMNNDETNGDNNGVHTSYGIYAKGNVTLGCDTIMIYSKNYSRWLSGSNAGSVGIYADGDITLNNTELKFRYPDKVGEGVITHFNKTPVDYDLYTKTAVPTASIESGESTELVSIGYAYVGEGSSVYSFNYARMCTLSFVENGANQTYSSITAPYGETIDYSANYPTHPKNWSFVGWFLDPEFTQQNSNTIVIYEDTTLYALWAPPATEVFVGGVTLDATNKYLVATNTADNVQIKLSASAELPSDMTRLIATFDEPTHTFTFNRGYTLVTEETNEGTKYTSYEPTFLYNSQIYAAIPEGETTQYGMKANGSIIIDLNGYSNMLYAHWTSTTDGVGVVDGNGVRDYNVIGISSLGNVDIIDSSNGKGYLSISAHPSTNSTEDSHAIKARGNIFLKGGTVVVYEGIYAKPTNGAETVFFHTSGNTRIRGAEVKVRTSVDGSEYTSLFNKEDGWIYEPANTIVNDDKNIAVENLYFGTKTRGTTKYDASYNTNSISYTPYVTLTFNSNGGSTFEGKKVLKYTKFDLTQYKPSLTGSTFGGWYTDEALTQKAEDDFTIYGDTTLYAKWSGNEHTITYVNDGSTETVKAIYGTTHTVKAAPEKAHHTFAGWYNGDTKVEGSFTVTGDITLTAKWTPVQYTLTFVTEGTSVDAVTKDYNTVVDLSTYTSTKDGYSFDGWMLNDEIVTEVTLDGDKEVTAKFTYIPKTFKLTYKDGEDVLEVVDITEFTTVQVNKAATKEHYTLDGWFVDGVEVTEIQNVSGDVTVSAKWTPVNYTITFNTDGGSAISAETVPYGTTYTITALTQKEHYTFAGWYNGDAKVEGSFTVEGNVTLTAKWTPVKYTLTYVDGEDTTTEEYVYNTDVTLEVPAAKAGWSFLGWYTEVELTNAVTAVKLDANKTVYAKWVENYTITYVVDGETHHTANADKGTQIQLIDAPVKPGYTFDGWLDSTNNNNVATSPYTVTSDVTFTASYTKDIVYYTFSYEVDGEIVETTTKAEGTVITLDRVETKAGYRFAGWSVDGNITGSVTLNSDTVAVAEFVKQYTLTLKAEGAEDITITDDLNKTIDLTAYAIATKTGHTTDGWTLNGELVTEVTLDADKEVVAKWTPVNYAITYNVDGVETTESATYGSTHTVKAAPSKEHYTFDGWYNGNVKVEGSFTVEGDVTLTAKWTPVKYTLTFVTEGSSVEAVTADYNTVVDLGTYKSTKAGYSFDGWFMGEYEVTEVILNSDVTVTAKFTYIPKTFKLTYMDGEDVLEVVDITEFTTVQVNKAATKEHYTLDGWYLDDEKVTEIANVSGDVTVSAKWTPVNYTITFNVNGGSAVEAVEVPYGTEYQITATTAKAGYSFDGWMLNGEVVNKITVDGNVTLEAKFTYIPKTFKLTYMDGENVLEVVDITEFTTVQVNKVATKEHYTLDGWHADGVKVTEIANVSGDVTVNAKWIPVNYTITYDVDGVKTTETATYGSTHNVKEDPSKEHYTFDGWYNGNAKVEGSFTVSGDVTLTAKWTPVKYTLTFVTEGTSVEAVTRDYNTTVNLVGYTSTKAGYSFDGWFIGEEKVESITLDGNKTVTAKFTYVPGSYTLTFVTEGTAVAPVTMVEGSVINLNEYTSTKAGYSFDGWFVGEEKVETITLNSNKEVTAKFTYIPKTFKLTYMDGEDVVEVVDITEFTTVQVDKVVTKTHYTLDGWFADGEKVTEIANVSGDVTVNAKWTPVKYTLTFVTEGSAVEAVTADYNTVIDLNNYTTSKAGYSFDGWFVGNEKVTEVTLDGNKEVTAKFTYIPVNYTLIFVTDGSAVAPVTMVEGSVINLNEYTTTKAGHSFDGWFIGEEKVESITLDSNKEVTAKFTYIPKTFKLTYKDGEDVLEVVDITEFTTVQVNKVATKEHYTLDGWYADGVKVTEIANVSGDVTVSAKWTPVNYTITFNVNGGSAVEAVEVPYGTEYQITATTAKAGYSFDGWMLNGEVVNKVTVDGNVTLDAKFTYIPKRFKLTYMDGEDVLEVVDITEFTTVQVNKAATKEHYTLDGWYLDDEKVTEIQNVSGDVTVNAKWTPVKYTLTFVTEGTSVEAVTKDYNTTINLNEYTSSKDKHSFDGWFVDDVKVESITLDGNKTVTAKFTYIPGSYTLTFVTDGTAVNPITMTEGTVIELSEHTSTKTGYTFDGWYIGEDEITTVILNDNVTVTAKFTINQYTLTFVTEGTPVDAVTKDYNTVIDLSAYTSTKDDYSFDGWFIGGEKVTEVTLDSDKEVTAKFTYIPVNYTLTFVTDGTPVDAVTKVEGTVIDLSSYTSTKDGYSFDGWFIGDEKVTEVTLDGNKSVEAKFTYIPKTFKLTYMDGEDVLEVVDITEFTTVQVNKVVTKNHYTFDGWYENGVKVTKITNVSGDVTVEAKWTPVNYSIAYIDETSEVITAAYGSTHTVKAAPSKEHYTFDGWFDGEVKIEGSFVVSGDVTLVAKWTPINYTITYVDETSEEVSAAYGSTHTVKAAPSKEHYTFDGWFNENGDKVEGSFTVEGDVKLTAKWTLAQYTLTFATEGTPVEAVTKDYNTVIDLSAYTSTKEGYTFDGWFIGEDKMESITLDGNKTVTAKFTEIIMVRGTVTSFLDEDETVTVELIASGEETAAYTTTVTGNTASYSIENVAAGTYTLRVSKAKHATREYIVTVSDATVTMDAKICLKGDVNGDGNISTVDATITNAYVQRRPTTLDEYALLCADVMGTDGKVSTVDAARINAHVKGTKLLW